MSYIDIVGKNEEEAKKALLDGVQIGRAKPLTKQDFPGAMPRSVLAQPAFPGKSSSRKLPSKLLIAFIAFFVITVAIIVLFGGPWSGTDSMINQPIHAPAVWEKAYIVNGQRIAYASPDTTYEIIRERLDGARESIHIGMFDFTATHVKDLLVNALERGVRVSLLLNAGGFDPSGEQDIIDEFVRRGANAIKMSQHRSRPLLFYHPKVIVIDRTWTLVQSANLTPNSVPLGVAGNRDTGVAIESRELAEFFIGLLEKDRSMASQAPDSSTQQTPTKPEPIYIPYEPVKRFPALRIDTTDSGSRNTANETARRAHSNSIHILPVLTPENYMAVLPQVLASAQKSIDIYQQYIRLNGTNVPKLLDAIKAAQVANPKLQVRIILSKLFVDNNDGKESLHIINERYNWRLSDSIRILNHRSGLNHTNKLIIIVDRRLSLVGSTNWSEAGVSKSREACLLIDSSVIADYYSKIFQADWDAGLTSIIESN
jgi:phosphatidylserine/phosphatidylglycerophosphate/cardiolipin synthase-like enzyme